MDRLTSMAAFVRAAESGSFVAAAGTLGISAQMVAKHVRALELRLGALLINRTTRRQSLTEFGEDFYARCRRILEDFDAIEAMADEARGAPRGKLRINAPVSFGSTLLVPMVTRYLNRHPDVEVDLVLNDRQVDLVREGYEAVFRIGTLADSDLVARRLKPYEAVLCASPDYLHRCGEPTKPADLAERECLGYAFSLQAAENAWRLLRNGEVHEVAIRNRLRISKGIGLVAAALEGFGIVLVARSLAAHHIQDGRLVRILPDYEVEGREMHLLFVADRRRTPKLRTFIDAAVEEFGPSGAS